MGNIARLAWALLLVISFGTAASATTHRGVLKGRVTDSEGAVISGAYVLIHWDPSGSGVGLTSNLGIQGILTLKTNKVGTFSVRIPPGFYDVFISAMAFTPECRKVRIKAGASVVYNAGLKADPLVTRELGDKMYSKRK